MFNILALYFTIKMVLLMGGGKHCGGLVANFSSQPQLSINNFMGLLSNFNSEIFLPKLILFRNHLLIIDYLFSSSVLYVLLGNFIYV